MKKAFCLVMVVALALGTLLCGCGRYSDADRGDNTVDGVIGNGRMIDDNVGYGNGSSNYSAGKKSEVSDINGSSNGINDAYGNNRAGGNTSGSNTSGGSANSGSASGGAASGSTGNDVVEYTTIAPSGRGSAGTNDLGQNISTAR